MKITELEIFPCHVPYIPAIQKYRPEGMYPTLIRVHTDEGITGLGGGGHEHKLVPRRILEERFAKLKGKELHELNPRDVAYPFDVALYDILGKALGVPVSWLLGGRVREKIPIAYWVVESATPEDTAEEALKAVKLGCRTIKFHTNPMEETTVARVKAIHEAVGDKIAIRIDRGYPWDLPMAVRIARQLKGYNIECFEDPLGKSWNNPWDVERHLLLKRKIDIPLAWHTEDPKAFLIAVKSGAIDYFNAGGLGSLEEPGYTEKAVSRCLRSAAIAEEAGMQGWVDPLGVSSGVQHVFGLHLASVIRNATMPADTFYMLEDDLIKGSFCEIHDGYTEVPNRPGLGIELDEAALEKYLVDSKDLP
ncbi:MAG: enolase C-terminal domain-like protein [Candidatus Bathyarchaeia archaeon]